MSLVNAYTSADRSPADILLADGTIAVVRPMRPTDRDGLVSLHELAGERSTWLRFFTVSRLSGSSYVDHLVRGTGDMVLTLVAERDHRIVGAATAERTGPDAAEVAFLVADDLQGRGVGSLLLEHLAAACHEQGIHRFTAEVLAENDGMLRVFRDAGFDLNLHRDQGTVHVELRTFTTSTALHAADTRDFKAEAASLEPLLYPTSVAVVGVRRDGKGIGTAVLRAIAGNGFSGQLHVVHPSADTILDIPCYRAVADVPGRLDLVVVAVPAAQVRSVIEDAAAKGARAAVVITSGFGELGAAGDEMQRAILRIARDHSIRLVGPNCLGVLDNDQAVRLNATFAAEVPRRGSLAVATQSGGVGIALLDLARELDLGIHTLVSLGNKADVSGNDLLAAWYDDPKVSAVALYLESFGNAQKFARIAHRFSERKPVLAIVGGRSSGGVRAGASHTAAAAAPSLGVEALFAQAGVIGCSSTEAMGRTALVLEQQPLPRGRRLGIVSNAGGIGVLAADCADDHALVVPEFSPALEDELRRQIDGTSGTSNPVDLGAAADGDHLERVVRTVLNSAEVDALLVPIVATSVTDGAALARSLGRVRRERPDIPVLLVAMGGLDTPPDLLEGVTVLHSPEGAIEALSLVAQYAEWRRTPHDDRIDIDDARATSSRAAARSLLGDEVATGRWLSPDQADSLIGRYGLSTVGLLAHDDSDAAGRAAEIGFPVVVKAADPNIVHKTDRGLVRTGLLSQQQVRAAVRDFARELEREAVPVLVQPTVNGIELAFGIARDPRFGPLVMVAAGGVAEAVWNDRAFLLPPVSRRDAARALRSLRIWPLLEGYRGTPPVDIQALEGLVCSLGQLAREVPEVAELDLNPVTATPDGVALVDVKVRVSASSATDGVLPRQLRVAP